MNQRNKEKMLRMEEAEEDGAITQEASNHAAPSPHVDDEKKEEGSPPDADLLGGEGMSNGSHTGTAGSSGQAVLNEEDQGTY